ncbi:MAG: alpha-L-rhamnosidase-related protein, partial [Candidatus Helarchaeales archaeon]
IKAPGYPKKGGEIPKDVFATAFFAHSTETLSKMARVLDLEKDAEKYDNRISTGFCSTLPLMMVLSQHGHVEKACELILSKRFPSWLYMIEQGATTMWERWDGYVKGRGFQNWLMNSFCHYAIGSVGEWLYRVVLGINPDENNPGFKHFFIRPKPGGSLEWAKGHYDSIRGRISVEWRRAGIQFECAVSIPPNCTARIVLPGLDVADVLENDRPISELKEISDIKQEENEISFEIESGNYRFFSRIG